MKQDKQQQKAALRERLLSRALPENPSEDDIGDLTLVTLVLRMHLEAITRTDVMFDLVVRTLAENGLKMPSDDEIQRSAMLSSSNVESDSDRAWLAAVLQKYESWLAEQRSKVSGS